MERLSQLERNKGSTKLTISLTQLFLNGISTGVGAAFGTIFSFIVLRYFPKLWGVAEGSVTKWISLTVKPLNGNDVNKGGNKTDDSKTAKV